MRKASIVLPLVASVFLALSACSGGGDAPTPTGTPNGGTANTAAPTDTGHTDGDNHASNEVYDHFTVVVEPKYYCVESFSEGRALVQVDDWNGKWGYIDANGQEVIEPKYDKATSFSEGVAFVNLYGRWGMIDENGNEVLPFTLEYEDIWPLRDGVAVCYMGGYIAAIDRDGNEIIPPGVYGRYFHGSSATSDGVTAVNETVGDGTVKILYIDKNGQSIRPEYYNSASPFQEGLAFGLERANGASGDRPRYEEWIYFDTTGKQAVPTLYNGVRPFSEGLAWVQQADGGNWGVIDKAGNQIIDFKYRGDDTRYGYFRSTGSPRPFSDGMAAMQLFSDKWGFVDSSGNERIPAMYDEVSAFKDGMAVVRRDGQWGFIDKDGNEIAPFAAYDDASPQNMYDRQDPYTLAYSGGALLMTDSQYKWGFITPVGLAVPFIYDNAMPFTEGLAAVALQEEESGDVKWGFIRLND